MFGAMNSVTPALAFCPSHSPGEYDRSKLRPLLLVQNEAIKAWWRLQATNSQMDIAEQVLRGAKSSCAWLICACRGLEDPPMLNRDFPLARHF